MIKTDIPYKTKPVILVVDDTLTGQRALASALHDKEYELSLASNGQEALLLATKIQPDVILLDVMMPDLSGYEVCQRIRANPDLREVPILMVTSLTGREDRLKGIDMGADDFISKPFDPLELRTRIRTITRLDRFRKLRELDGQITAMKQDIYNLEKKKSYLQKLAMVDDLTQLHNRRSLLHRGQAEFERARRYNGDLSALMIDVDRFKQINDTYGHGTGSAILKNVAFELSTNLRTLDIAGRLGGDEFLIFLPHTSLDSGYILAERLRKAIYLRGFKLNDNIIHLTISVGVGSLTASMRTLDDLMEAADMALYRAKETRNSVM